MPEPRTIRYGIVEVEVARADDVVRVWCRGVGGAIDGAETGFYCAPEHARAIAVAMIEVAADA